ncbi:hypothetical protein F8388_013555 [Cannabis sativa]|uniref:Zinc knuckle CX2CX4HX4C domain-containing protein n=1 Tax=Cannabis sativa TaxID=3483 RepID=A0A7J6G8Y8_CANSA|nr:hypothetical protein F8388_013555 [Cannabis sativa]KAF4398431.1 hypothetical protein G4B88_025410 [Cannabis sativa]
MDYENGSVGRVCLLHSGLLPRGCEFFADFSMGDKGKEIQVDFIDVEKDELMKRDSNLEMEMLELFEDITLEDVVVSKACVGKCEDGVLGFFFDDEDDYHFVMEKRPWIINGVLLNLKPWPVEGEVRFLSNENVPILAKKVGNLVKMEEKRKEELVRRGYLRCWIEVWLSHPFPSGFFLKADDKPDSWVQFKYEKLPHLCFNCGKLAHWDKICSAQTTMVIPTGGFAVPMYGTWIKSDAGRSNCFNMGWKGTTRSLMVREEILEWDFAKSLRRHTWKRNKNSEVSTAKLVNGVSLDVQVVGKEAVATKDKESGQKRKIVHGGTSTTPHSELQSTEEAHAKVADGISNESDIVVQNMENVGNRQLEVGINEVGPNYLDLPTPDFSLRLEGIDMIPDIGPTIAQSLDIPHSWLCRSQRPHDVPEPTPIKWPNDDLEAQKMFFQLYGPDFTDMYKAQASLICNPPDLSMMIVQLLGTKKMKPHTWYHPCPAVTNFPLPVCPVSVDRTRKSSRRNAWRSNSGAMASNRGSGVKTRRGRKNAENQKMKVGLEDMYAFMNRLGFLNVIGIPSVGIGGGLETGWGGGRRFQSQEGAFLRNFLDDTGGVDLGFQVVRCTWQNARKGVKNVRKRLDRGLADASWCIKFPNAKVLNLPILGSDHSPILLTNRGDQRKLNYPFRFLEVWTSSSDCEKVVDSAWKYDAQETQAGARRNPKQSAF